VYKRQMLLHFVELKKKLHAQKGTIRLVILLWFILLKFWITLKGNLYGL
jgi:hypothetical protein